MQTFPYPNPVKCHYCNKPATIRCGFVLGLPTNVSSQPAIPFTCNRPVCFQHGIDTLCEDHAAIVAKPPIAVSANTPDQALHVKQRQLREKLGFDS
jgi:hypothetical protein